MMAGRKLFDLAVASRLATLRRLGFKAKGGFGRGRTPHAPLRGEKRSVEREPSSTHPSTWFSLRRPHSRFASRGGGSGRSWCTHPSMNDSIGFTNATDAPARTGGRR
jgi:hypothetical protein